jgi:pimeloyl-ACP methyl ester carboxylesterase
MLLEVRRALVASAGGELAGAATTLTARQFGAALTERLRLRLPRAQLAAAAEAFEAASGADAEASAASVDLDEFVRSVHSAGAPDAFCLRGVPAPTLAELSSYFRFLRADAVLPLRISLPLLWLHGAADALSKLRPAESFFAQVGAADKQLVPLDELRHGVFGDADAPRACAHALAWVEALCAKLPAPARAEAQEDEGGSEEDDAEAEFPQAPATMVPVPRPLAASESEKQRVV